MAIWFRHHFINVSAPLLLSMAKLIINKAAEQNYIKDSEKDFHFKHGFIRKEDLTKERAATNTGEEYAIIEPQFIDHYQRIRRGAQIIQLKDIAAIIAETGINKESRIVDAGAGSGALCCYLAHIAKEVFTYEIREDFANIVQKNIEFLSLNNITLVSKSIYDGIDQQDVDLITLDLPEPWKAIEPAKAALKRGGFMVSYSPTVPQFHDFVNAVHDNESFVHLKTIEVIQREWEVKDRRVRPKTVGLWHTGFLSFV